MDAMLRQAVEIRFKKPVTLLDLLHNFAFRSPVALGETSTHYLDTPRVGFPRTPGRSTRALDETAPVLRAASGSSPAYRRNLVPEIQTGALLAHRPFLASLRHQGA